MSKPEYNPAHTRVELIERVYRKILEEIDCFSPALEKEGVQFFYLLGAIAADEFVDLSDVDDEVAASTLSLLTKWFSPQDRIWDHATKALGPPPMRKVADTLDEERREKLMLWLSTQLHISVHRGSGGSAWPREWVINVNPMDGTGPRIYHHADFWEALQIARVAFP